MLGAVDSGRRIVEFCSPVLDIEPKVRRGGMGEKVSDSVESDA